MKYQIKPALLTALLFSIWSIPTDITEVIYGVSLIITLAILSLETVFFRVVSTSSKPKAVSFFVKFNLDKKAINLRSVFRTSIYLCPVVIYVQSSVIYLFASIASVYTTLLYFSYLGRTFEKDLDNPEDFVDEEE